MATLGVNIDHVATIRQARRTVEPDPVWAARSLATQRVLMASLESALHGGREIPLV